MNSKNDDGWDLIPKGMSDGWRFAISLIMLSFYLIALPFHLLMLTVGYLRDIIGYFKKPPPPFNNTPQLEQDTRNLVEKLKPHKLAKDDPLSPENFAVDMASAIFKEYPSSLELIKAIMRVVVPLIEQERFLEMPVPTPSDDIMEQAKYRDELRAVTTKHRNFIETKRAFEDAIIESMIAFLKALPPAAFSTEGNTTVSLEDLIENPQKLLWDIISPFYSNDILQRHLFKQLTDQIDENVRKQKDVLPQDAQGTTAELFNKYLYDTPLRKITGAQIPFEIPDRFLPEHRLVVASTGTGKTMYIQQDVYHYLQREQRPGIVIIDSQNVMIPKLERLNVWRDDLIIIDPQDISPPALNMFALPDRIKSYDRNTQEVIESTTIQLFGFLFAALDQTLTGRQATFFSFVTRLVLSIPGATIRTLREVLEEEPKTPEQSQFWPYVQTLDADAQAFFKNQFYHKNHNQETRRGIVQRLYGILRVPAFNRMFTTKENKLDLFEELNAGKTILINTSKTLLGDDASSIFARYCIAQTLSAAFQRVAIRPPYRLALIYIDEAWEVMKDATLSTLFTQARKYELGALIAFQNLEQMPDKLDHVILANTSTKLVAGLRDKNARALATDMRTTPEWLLSLRKHKRCLRVRMLHKRLHPPRRPS